VAHLEHVKEHVDAPLIGGVNEAEPAIALRRVEPLARHVPELTE
jgi:hypothetical protein